MTLNLQKESDLAKLAEQAKECYHLSDKRAQVFAAQAKALQKNLQLRKIQKQAWSQQNNSTDVKEN